MIVIVPGPEGSVEWFRRHRQSILDQPIRQDASERHQCHETTAEDSNDRGDAGCIGGERYGCHKGQCQRSIGQG